jgi:hypothetical protein
MSDRTPSPCPRHPRQPCHHGRVDIAELYALSPGPAPLVTGAPGALTVRDLGIVRVASGTLGIADPFVALDRPLTLPIPPGDYPVKVTVADVSEAQDGSHLREAYLSVLISTERAVTVEPIPGPDGPPEEGSFFGVPVDAGTVAFFDADAVEASMPPGGDNWYDDVFDSDEPNSWFAAMESDSPHPAGTANIVMPRAADGENVVLSHSGWGDGFYPVLQTLDAAGGLVAVHIDLQVAGSAAPDEPDAAEASATRGTAETAGASETARTPDSPRSGWLARLFGK